MDLVAGSFVGELELLAPAGAGGFSIVWKARDPRTKRLFALKLPRVEALLDHLRNEADRARTIDDAQVVPILASHLDADPPHLVMPWIDGEVVALPIAPPEPREIVKKLELVLDLARVLARLHGHGLVHGDVKPGNVLVDRDGRVHLLDLGLALPQVKTKLDRSLAQSVVSVDGKSIAGTLDYMAPELFDGRLPTCASDVYGLGVLLHHVATGRPPAFGVSPAALNPYLPPGFDGLLRDVLHHDPELRLESAVEVVPVLERLVRAERRCLARKNGHERRRVRQERLATLVRGLRMLLVGLATLVAMGAVFAASIATIDRSRGESPLAVIAMIVWALVTVSGGAFLATVPLLLAMTTINAWLLGVPEKTYKNRVGHPIWSFMMQ